MSTEPVNVGVLNCITNIIDWVNKNDGALMVLITLVYVVATICISHSNRTSAKASRKQLEESQKQQKQNVGLQLYDRRKEVIKKYPRRNTMKSFGMSICYSQRNFTPNSKRSH